MGGHRPTGTPTDRPPIDRLSEPVGLRIKVKIQILVQLQEK